MEEDQIKKWEKQAERAEEIMHLLMNLGKKKSPTKL